MIIDMKEIIGGVGHTGMNASKPGHGEHLHLEINRYDNNKKEIKSLSAREIKMRIDNIK